MCLFHEGAVVFDVARCVGVLQDAGEGVRREFHLLVLAYAEADALRDGAGGHHGKCLREDAFVDEDHVGSRLLHVAGAQGVHHGDGFGGCCRLVQQGAVGEGHSGQVGHGGLEVKQGFQSSLRHFGLVGGVGGVPHGVLEDVPLDDGRGDGVVPSHADVGGVELVFGGESGDVSSELMFRHGGGEFQRLFQPDVCRDGLVYQLVQAFHSYFAEHLRFVLFADADVSAG